MWPPSSDQSRWIFGTGAINQTDTALHIDDQLAENRRLKSEMMRGNVRSQTIGRPPSSNTSRLNSQMIPFPKSPTRCLLEGENMAVAAVSVLSVGLANVARLLRSHGCVVNKESCRRREMSTHKTCARNPIGVGNGVINLIHLRYFILRSRDC